MTVGFVTNPDHAAHAAEGHPERPERLDAALALLDECGLRARLHEIAPRAATDEELALVHPPAFVAALERACAGGGGWVDADTYLTPRSCAAARSAVGSTLAAVDAVCSGSVRSAFAAVRPPGHHASPAHAMGFCLLNNVAVAARYAQRRHGLEPFDGRRAERVAIVDIDVHHGNGTQDAFYDDASVLYVSTHQYPFYPGTGRPNETGAGEGAGTNVNIAMPAGCGDEQYVAAFESVVEPAVRRFRPELLLVSCGFDAHYADPIAEQSLSVGGYGELTARLRTLAEELCDERLVLALEGGYDLDAVSWGVRTVIEVMLGASAGSGQATPTPDPLGPGPGGPDITQLLAEVRRLHGL